MKLKKEILNVLDSLIKEKEESLKTKYFFSKEKESLLLKIEELKNQKNILEKEINNWDDAYFYAQIYFKYIDRLGSCIGFNDRMLINFLKENFNIKEKKDV